MSDGRGVPSAYHEAVAAACAALLDWLRAFEAAQRRLHPPRLRELERSLAPRATGLAQASARLAEVAVPAGLEPFHAQLVSAAQLGLESARLFAAPAQGGTREEWLPLLLESVRRHCRAQEAIYPLRQALPPIARFFVEAGHSAPLAELDPEPVPGVSVGIHSAGPGGDPEGRGGFTLYVPERYDGRSAWPLVVALHGGFGHGRDFLWTWLREARSRRFLLLAPTSQRASWSLDRPDRDGAALRSMLALVQERWRVDPERILLTGLSDGGTYALLCGLAEDSPFRALACVAGVLHPASLANGGAARAAGRRVYLAHGELDWLFPIALARLARDALVQAGADVTLHEIEDLSHAYPREENDRILRWFDPSLALA